MHSAVHRYWGPSVEKASLQCAVQVFLFFFTTCCLTFRISVFVGVFLHWKRWQEQQQMRVWSSLQTRSCGFKEDIILCVYVWVRSVVWGTSIWHWFCFITAIIRTLLYLSCFVTSAPLFCHHPFLFPNSKRGTSKDLDIEFWIYQHSNIWRTVGSFQSWLTLSGSHAASHVPPASGFFHFTSLIKACALYTLQQTFLYLSTEWNIIYLDLFSSAISPFCTLVCFFGMFYMKRKGRVLFASQLGPQS